MAIGRFGQGQGMDEWSRRVHDIMDEMLNRDYVHFRDTKTWQPATNVYETRDHYYICVELAGVDYEQIDLECLDERRVRFCGLRTQPRPEGVSGPLSVHAMEIDEGPFSREVELPEEIDVAVVEASYEKGFLWITLPKANKS